MANQRVLRRVLLLIEAPTAFTLKLIRGVTSYSQSHGHWMMTLREGRSSDLLPLLDDLSSYDGVIARIECGDIHQRIKASSLPFVNVSGTNFDPQVPWVTINHESVVRLVVQEFRNNGHTHFAFFGPVRRAWSCQRENCFQKLIAEKDLAYCGTFLTHPEKAGDEAELQRIQDWITSLPHPVAIMSANDVCGNLLLRCCHAAGLSVPNQVAVIGVNNDELLCELSYPTLTSVSTNTEKIGYESAEILSQLMSGKNGSSKPVRVEPLGIESRRSTNSAAGADPFVGLAFRFIQQHACDGINVEDVLKLVPMSRTALETAFREFIGRSPHHEITRIRMERARRMLAESELPIADVARRCGYSTVDYFSAAFKRKEGVSPSDFRRMKM